MLTIRNPILQNGYIESTHKSIHTKNNWPTQPSLSYILQLYIVSTCPLHSKLASLSRPASLASTPTCRNSSLAVSFTDTLPFFHTPCFPQAPESFYQSPVPRTDSLLGDSDCLLRFCIIDLSPASPFPPIPWHCRCASIAITFCWSLLRHLLAAYFGKRPGVHRVSSLAPSTLQKNPLPFSPQGPTNPCPPQALLTFNTTATKHSPTSASVTLQHSLNCWWPFRTMSPYNHFCQAPPRHFLNSHVLCSQSCTVHASSDSQPQGGQSFFERKMLLGLAMQPPACTRVSTTAPYYVCFHFTIPNPAANLDCPENRPYKKIQSLQKKGLTPNSPCKKFYVPGKKAINLHLAGAREACYMICSQFIYDFGSRRCRRL